ncbi:hypothetical protein V6N13_096244 [Hibiscus sabdariffa]
MLQSTWGGDKPIHLEGTYVDSSVKEALKDGFHCRVGIESNALMLQSTWGGDKPIHLEGTYVDSPVNPICCKEFMIPENNRWDARKVGQVFNESDTQKILGCPIARAFEDKVIWGHHSKGLYMTRSGHHWLLDKEEERTNEPAIWKAIAKLLILPKICIFGWRLGQEALPGVSERPRDAKDKRNGKLTAPGTIPIEPGLDGRCKLLV